MDDTTNPAQLMFCLISCKEFSFQLESKYQCVLHTFAGYEALLYY